jgi:hypothetical protein
MTARSATVAAQAGTGLVLLTLASGQFLMTSAAAPAAGGP